MLCPLKTGEFLHIESMAIIDADVFLLISLLQKIYTMIGNKIHFAGQPGNKLYAGKSPLRRSP